MLGVDLGTTAVKVAAFTLDGRPVAASTVAHPTHRPHPGWAQQDPSDWWRGCVQGIDTVLESVSPASIRSIGLVGQVNTHVFVDEALRPLAPAIIWQDQRCADVARELDARFTAEEKTDIWGSPIMLDASFVGARAEWFAREHPELWARTRWVLAPRDYVAARLTGEVATDLLSGVRVTGPDGYLTGALAVVDELERRMPPIVEMTTSLGAATEVRLPDTDVVVGTMDALGSVFGTRTTEPGRGMLSCGTSLVAAAASVRANPVGEVVTFPPRNGTYVHFGPTQAAGDAVRWWAELSGRSVPDVFAAATHGRPGVIFTPHLSGERAPLWDPDVRASFLGIDASTTDADLALAVLQGVAMSGRHALEAVERAAGYELPSVAYAGGGARSDLWAQLQADVLRRPVERLRVPDSGVLGAALLGAVGAGCSPDVETAAAEAVAVEREFLPNVHASDRLEPLYRAYRASYDALADIHDILADHRARHPVHG